MSVNENVPAELTAEEKKLAKAKAKRKKKIIQSLCIAGAVIAVIVVAILIIKPIAKGLDNVVSEDVPEGYKTYNASRYFFRFDYPENWKVNTDTAGFGFMQDSDTGLVVTLVPLENKKAEDEETQYSEDVSARFYYRDFGEKILDNEASFSAFVEEVKAGLLEKNGMTDLDIDTMTSYNGRNETFCRAEFEYKSVSDDTVATDGDEDVSETEPSEKVYRGVIFVSARSMAYCAVVVSFEEDAEEIFYKNEKTFQTVVDTFRFSVFED